jgi:uncharacterized protein (TIGR00269 family)
MHGDIERILRVPDSKYRFIPRIKPLAEVPERETMLYAYAVGCRFQSIPCPHGGDALRGDIRALLNRLELKHQGLKYTICSSTQRLADASRQERGSRPFRECLSCGDPTPNETCEACTMLNAIKRDVTAIA